jgi:serine/threonine protein kinase
LVQGIRGQYRVGSELGVGGLGKVWKGTAKDGTSVAIKEPLDQGQPTQVRINFDKLRIEAEVLEKLTGPRPMILRVNQATEGYTLDQSIQGHIVRFLDVDRIERPRALVLEFLDGKSLDDEVRSVKQSDFKYIDEYSKTILNLVKALHQNNILHRDISPHNLITTPDPNKNPVLIDFGTVKEGFNQIDIAPPQWSQIIKPGYSAPELSVGLASPSSDLYSAAATILFMYTGVNPQYLRTSAGELDEVKIQLHNISKDRLLILKKAMSYQPGDRYQTADDMINALAGKFTQVTAPHIVASGRRFLIQKLLTIGRKHQCETECRKRGFSTPPDVAINDPERYIGRHHAVLRTTKNGECFLEDLNSVSGTAVRHAGSQLFVKLPQGQECRLMDGDVVALAYSPTKGAYMTFSYHAR